MIWPKLSRKMSISILVPAIPLTDSCLPLQTKASFHGYSVFWVSLPPSATCNCSFEFQRTGALSYHPAQCLADSRGWGHNWQRPGAVLTGLGQSVTETEAECYEPYTFELFNLIPSKFYQKPSYNEGLLTYIATCRLIAESDSVLIHNRETLA